jgi:hypothetical protein
VLSVILGGKAFPPKFAEVAEKNFQSHSEFGGDNV